MTEASLNRSLEQLQTLTSATYSSQTAPIANAIWEKHLQMSNPQWDYVMAKAFFHTSSSGSAHVMAMLDKRLPKLGLVGYFACSNSKTGAEVLEEAGQWLRRRHSTREVYGPINGTATSDYRLNMADDYWFPGEPVNPLFHIDAFREAGFSDFNHYASGLANHYQLFSKLFIRLPKDHEGIRIRPFNVDHQLHDLKVFHELMTTIFPEQSIYCPVLSWEERLYNFQDKDPFFNPRYTYFLEDQDRPIGLIVSYPYNNNLILKTVGVLPEYRGRRLSSLLIRKVHEIAAEDNLEAAIYAMIRQGNAVYRMKKPGVKVARHYVTMKKNY